MKIRLQQLNPTIGDLINNKKFILDALSKAENDGVELILFSELITCGYPAMDLLERKGFREAVYETNQEIIEATRSTAVVFGTITKNDSGKGRPCFNSAIVAQYGKLVAEVRKALLPTYDVFDELRYFEPNFDFEPVHINGISFGVTVCEDIWFNDSDIQYHFYDLNPAQELANKGAEVILNLSASPVTKSSPVNRLKMLQNRAKQVERPLLYASQAGANTDLIFDGDSLVLDKNGKLLTRADRFVADFVDVQIDETGEIHAMDPKNIDQEYSKPEVIFEALTTGVREYLKKSKAAKKVILGLSGGIDSALVATIATKALGAENVVAVTMPSEFSSPGSVTDSQKLAENLGIELMEIPIEDIYNSFRESLAPAFKGTEFNVAEENLQSRARGVLLMAIANKFGYILLNTGNKSELAVGYCTLYGDMAGGIAVIADVYKTEVYELCRWLNQEYYQREVIPGNILTKAPSAELRPDQKDTDSLPEYNILDAILKLYIEEQKSREDILRHDFNEEVVDRVLRLVDLNEYKRIQAPPALRVSGKAFGSGRRMPVVQQWTSQKKVLRKKP